MMLRRLAFLMLLLLSARPAAADIRAVESDPPADLPAFQLSDHAGRPFTADSLKGQWDLILLGFTHCPDVCPFVLSNLAQLREEMSLRVSPENLPRVVFVAIDPQRDEAVLADYVAYFHPDFLGVTGARDQIATFVEGIDGFARLGEPDRNGHYEVRHSAAVVLVAPDGRMHAQILPPIDPGAAAEYLARKQLAYRRGAAEITQ